MKLKRYIVFAGESLCPEGGISDYTADFDSMGDALDCMHQLGSDWAHVFDTEKGKYMEYSAEEYWLSPHRKKGVIVATISGDGQTATFDIGPLKAGEVRLVRIVQEEE